MAYHRRRRSQAATKAKIRYKKPSAKNQKNQIASLKHQIDVINKKVTSTLYTIQHSHQITGNLTSPLSANALIDPGTWGQVFSDTSFQSSGGGKYTGYRLAIDFRITPRTEHQSVNFTVFLAYPKNIKIVNECGGAAAATCTALQSNRDYVFYGGLTLLNKKRWGIVKCWRMTTLPVVTESAGTEYINATKANRRYCNIRNPLKVNNRVNNWNQMSAWDIKPKQRLHLFVFNDNLSALEGSPTINVQCLMSGQTSA